MYEQAFRNIDRVLRNELGRAAGIGYSKQTSRLFFDEYFDKLPHDKAAEFQRLLERLDRIKDEPNYARARYRFAAATSEAIRSARLSKTEPGHFLRVTRVGLQPFLEELANAHVDWGKSARNNVTVHRETRSIALAIRATKGMTNKHDQYVKRSKNANQFTALEQWLHKFAATTGKGSLQIVRIVKLKGRGQVYPHVDRGLYYLIRDRYHLVLRSPSGSRMRCEDQISTWHTGELWWFNNHVIHDAANDSNTERIHVIFDVLPRRNQVLVPLLQQYAAPRPVRRPR